MMLSMILLVYSMVVLSILTGWPGLVVLGLVGMAFMKVRRRVFVTLGSGRFATDVEMARAGMIGGKGLIVGRLPTRWFHNRLVWLFARGPAEAACRQYLGYYDPIRVNSPHVAVFAPSGAGKGVSLVIPWLLSTDESAVVVDVKGELARITANARRKMGHRVILVDPMQEVTKTPDSLNPLDFIDPNSPTAIDECARVGDALVVRTGQEKEQHFLDRAVAWLTTMIAFTVYAGRPENGTKCLPHVATLLSNPAAIKLAIQEMTGDQSIWGGSLARMAGQLAHSTGEELGSTMSTVGRFTSFMNSPAVAESLKKSTFNPADLRRQKMTVYLILSAKYASHSHVGLMRLWLVTLMNAMLEGGVR